MSATPGEPVAQRPTNEQRLEIARRVHDQWWNWNAALEVRVALLMEKAGLKMDDEELAERIRALGDEADKRAGEAGSTKPPPADRGSTDQE